jgi:hypothetical protein
MSEQGGSFTDPKAIKTTQPDSDCAEFQASMADRIGAGEDLQDNPHLRSCERCSSLVSELEAIAEVARQLMPIDAEPDDDLWSKIESKLALEGPDGQDGTPSGEAARKNEESRLGLDNGMALEGGVA